MKNMKVDDFNQIIGFSQHDAQITNINLGKNLIEFQLITTHKVKERITFNHLSRLVINNLREGNIIDRFYIYSSNNIPAYLASRLEKLFTTEEIDYLGKEYLVLTMESSYGAEFFALVKYQGDIDNYLQQLSFLIE